ncbi:MAG: 5'-3' exonuclease H3TH domain-containing protein, partial [Pseudomonadota bacterium]|nr:5'-3' exonuclease H3TH domain-containing protein [Pseudomonadota bacterium]
MSNANTLILIDGSAYLYRAYHALPALTTPEGLPTGALYGMTQMLKSVLNRYQPHYAAVIFDAKGPTFRTTLYADYKANRAAMADDLVQQLPKIYELVQALGFPLLMETEVEADDVIATLAKQAEAQGMHTFILSGDKDFAQLVNAQISLIDTMTMTQFDEAAIQAKFGIPPALIVDYLALIGDSVDNIPGVNKVGPKTAVKWLTQYGSLAHLIAHAEDISGKVGEHLRAALPWLQHTAPALLTLRTQVPLAYTPQQLTLKPPQIEDLRRLFKQLAFKQWLKDLPPPQHTTPQHPYSLILTQTEFEHWLRQLQQAPLFAFDTETTGLNYLTAQIVGVSFALGPKQAAYVPLAHDYPGAPEQLSREQVLKALKPLLEAAQPSKIGQNLKYDQHILANHGIQLQGGIYDTMLESYVLNSTATAHDMDSLALNYLDKQTIHFEDIAGKGKKQLTFNQIE